MLHFVEIKEIKKELGSWTNDGKCVATSGVGGVCGPGTQKQTRPCKDGTVEKCTPEDKKQTVSCADANTALPPCPKGKPYTPKFQPSDRHFLPYNQCSFNKSL